MVSVSNNNKHLELQNIIKNELLKSGYKAIFFETIKKKPQKEQNQILIHDLHYSPLDDLYKKEWPDLINEFKYSLVVIWGSKDKIHKIDVKAGDFYKLWLEWIQEVKDENDFDNFKTYIIKILPKLYSRHKDLRLKLVGEKLLTILNKGDWIQGKNEVLSLLNESLSNIQP